VTRFHDPNDRVDFEREKYEEAKQNRKIQPLRVVLGDKDERVKRKKSIGLEIADAKAKQKSSTGPWGARDETLYGKAKARADELQKEIDTLRELGIGGNEVKNLEAERDKQKAIMDEEKRNTIAAKSGIVPGGIPSPEFFGDRITRTKELIDKKTEDKIKEEKDKTGKRPTPERKEEIRKEVAEPYQDDVQRLEFLRDVYKDYISNDNVFGTDPKERVKNYQTVANRLKAFYQKQGMDETQATRRAQMETYRTAFQTERKRGTPEVAGALQKEWNIPERVAWEERMKANNQEIDEIVAKKKEEQEAIDELKRKRDDKEKRKEANESRTRIAIVGTIPKVDEEEEKAKEELDKADEEWDKAEEKRDKAKEKWKKVKEGPGTEEWEKAYEEWDKADEEWDKAEEKRDKAEKKWRKADKKRREAESSFRFGDEKTVEEYDKDKIKTNQEILERQKKIAGYDEQLKKLGAPKNQLQTYDYVDMYRRAVEGTTTFSTSSGYDVLRGAKGRDNEMLTELKTQTDYLKNIEENINTMGD